MLLLVLFCGACSSPVTRPEWKDQPLIFPTAPATSSGFAAIEQDGQSVTLTADFGVQALNASPEGLKQIDIQRLASVGVITEGRQDLQVGPINVARAGTHLYTAFSARAAKPGRISLAVYQNQRLAPGLLKVLEPGKEWTRYRFILRMHQPADEIVLRIQTDAAVEIEDFGALSKMPVLQD